MFKKTCYECGNKIDVLYEGKCEKCFTSENPPISEIKPLNIKYCNHCKKINYNNQYYEPVEFVERIVDLIKKNIIINQNYTLKELKIENFEIIGEKVAFDIEVDCDLKE